MMWVFANLAKLANQGVPVKGLLVLNK